MRVVTLRALGDNYVFLLRDEATAACAVVDPGEAQPVLDYLAEHGGRLTAILNTHHHADHTGGNRALLARFPCVPVFGGARDRGRIPCQTAFMRDGDAFAIVGVNGRVLEVPGHTRGHVAYFFGREGDETGDLFAGDTVFGGTIGNLFEGTPEVMFESVQKIRALPPRTRIWCGHEYTLTYVRESAGLDPGNAQLAARRQALEASAGQPTVPLRLDEECATNPFFRWDAPDLALHLGTRPGFATFRRLCELT
jgi:hydroxyacylglutathione hydrolase